MPKTNANHIQKDFSAFENAVGVKFKDKALLAQAFTHRSYINENPGTKLSHNERLEFLGDAVLELVVTEVLYEKYPNSPEGELTAYRSALVNAVILSSVANDMGMDECLMLSRGEARDKGKARTYILANTFEAYIGALYLDQGYDAASKLIGRVLLPKTEEIVEKRLWQDAKSLVQEKSQEYFSVTPSYKVIGEAGPDHDKQFTVAIYFGADKIAEGKGKSKQEAEQAAAREAIDKNKWN